MFTNRHEIRRIDLLKSEYTQVVPTLKNAVALDVDVSTNKMFWCDLFHQKIYRYTLTHTTNVQTVLFFFTCSAIVSVLSLSILSASTCHTFW